MVVSVQQLNQQLTKYDTIDQSLIVSRDYVRQFGTPEDYVEYHIYTKSGNLISSFYDYKGYSIPDTLIQGSTQTYTQQLEFNPGLLLEQEGYTFGTYDVQFNIFRKKVFNTNQKIFFIKEISSDRTEIKVSSNLISSTDIETGTLNFLYEIQDSAYFKDFLLNFGDNKLVNGVNIALDRNTDPYSILIKLYQPLPDEFGLKSSFWIVEELSEAPVYEVVLAPTPIPEVVPQLKPANFDIDVDSFSIKPSEYLNIDGLLSNQSINAYQQVLNALNQKGIQINVDYSDYSNFVQFSSAKERLLNFKYKLQLIEGYTSDITSISSTVNYNVSTNSSSSIISLQNKIDTIIKNFDGYETYLYYTSESAAWPKSTGTKPYTLYSVSSNEAVAWLGDDNYNSPNYGGQLATASLYDLENQDNLAYIVPEYISVDPVNDGYTLFLNMVGQHFDNIFIYIKAITDLTRANNNLNKGISKDIVYYALRSLGIKLYNSKSDDNIFEYLIGSTPSGSFAPTGSQYDTIIAATNETVPGQDIQKEILKRIYHNLPLLLKSKGTARGVKALISSFGIPNTILTANEFGGADKLNNTVDYTYDRFSYALNISGAYVKSYWGAGYDYPTGSITDYVPNGIEFRFKPDKDFYATTASLATLVSGSDVTMKVDMFPDSTSGTPYSLIKLSLLGNAGYVTASLSLPIYATGSTGDTYWWNVLVQKRNDLALDAVSSSQYYDIYVKDKIDLRIGHQASASIYIGSNTSASYNANWNAVTQSLYLNTGSAFVGYAQELRYWTAPLSESVFDYHVLNPESIRGDYSGSAYNDLSARFPLGNDLYIYNHSLTGSVFSIQPNYVERESISGAFIKSASFFDFPNQINYVPNDEEYVTDSPNSVYSNPVNQKVRIVNNVITGSVLSPFIRMEDTSDVYRTIDTHFVDASFSPQNEVNKDIIAQYGNSINIDEYIGDPRNSYIDTYPLLEHFKEEYFKKYESRYDLKDYVRLIKFFDNSLFKMIKDYVPGRSNVYTGLTIKSPMIERPKAKQAEPSLTENYNSVDGEITDGDISAGSIYNSGYGDGSDFYLGNLSGSTLDVNKDFEQKNYNPYALYSGSIDQAKFDRSDYNALINVVTESIASIIFQKINPYQKGVLEPVEINDENYTDPAYTTVRYRGSKVSSAKYNFYTSQSVLLLDSQVVSWNGDTSYGKTAAIDSNVLKFSFSNNIVEKNVNFYDKTTINLKYLIDASGSTVELSSANSNLFEVQNMFKKGDYVDIYMFDKYRPTNQSTLDGSKEVFEGGFNYSPILFRETAELLNFTFIEPTDYTTSRLGVKAVNTSSFIWQTIGNTNTDFATTPNGTNTIFKINGLSTTSTAFSLSKKASSTWPYLQFPLNGYNLGLYKDYTNTYYRIGSFNTTNANPHYFAIDWFLPNGTGSLNGGYSTTDMQGKVGTFKSAGENYSYIEAPRSSSYVINIDIPVKVSANNPDTIIEPSEDRGPAIVKIIGIIEVQKSGTGSWNYINPKTKQPYGVTKFTATNIPLGLGNIIGGPNFAAVDELNSFLYFPETMSGGTFGNRSITPFFEGRCQAFNVKADLDQGDRIRVRVYFAEVTGFFKRSQDIYYEMQLGDTSNAFFEIYDAVLSTKSIVTSGSIGTTSPLFTAEADNQTITFNDSASMLYGVSVFEPEPSGSITPFYSPVSDAFTFRRNDLFRFTSYYSIQPEYFLVDEVIEPQFIFVGTTKKVLTPLQVRFNKRFNVADLSTANFAILRRVPDETSLIINFKKKDGITSNALILPYNLKPDIKNSVSDIVRPLKDTLLSNVTIFQ